MDEQLDMTAFEADLHEDPEVVHVETAIERGFEWNDKFATAKNELDMLKAIVMADGGAGFHQVYHMVAEADADTLRFLVLAAVAPNARILGHNI